MGYYPSSVAAASGVYQLPYPTGGDDTATLNSALAAIANEFGSGIAQAQNARYSLAGVGTVTVPPNVIIKGAIEGPVEPASNPALTTFGTTFLITGAGTNPFTLGQGGSGIEDAIFYWPNQVAPTAAAPTAYPDTITMPLTSFNHKLRRLVFVNAYNAFQLFGGKHWIEDLLIGCLGPRAILLDESKDFTHWRGINIEPIYDHIAGLSYPQNIDTTFVLANMIALQVGRADNFVFDDLSIFSCFKGVQMTDSTDVALNPRCGYGIIDKLTVDTCKFGIEGIATNTNVGLIVGKFLCNSTVAGGAPAILTAGGTVQPYIQIKGGKVWGTNTAVPNPPGNVGILDITGLRGWEPLFSGSPPAVPASGTAIVNPLPGPALVYIQGGTVTAVQIGSTVITTTGGTFRVGAGQGITLTYSAAPTWAWQLDA